MATTMMPKSPIQAGFDDWLNLDQAADPTTSTAADSASFPFTNAKGALSPNAFDFDFATATTSPPTSFLIPPASTSTSSLFPASGIDPLLAYSSSSNPTSLAFDSNELASPLTFSPSSASSNLAHPNHAATPSENGDDPARGIPTAVDPTLTAPSWQLPRTIVEESSSGGEETAMMKMEEDDGEDEMMSRSETPVNRHRPTTRGADQAGAMAKSGHHPHALVDVPDWGDRPSEAEYRKMSSKEKRQLRNKISARNFRHRRKEHISTLEQQLDQRDEIIDGLRTELTSTKAENKELRGEVDLLKTKWADLMKRIDDMAAGNTKSSPSPAPGANSTRAPIPQVNRFKDVGARSGKAFDGTGAMLGGNIGVHTTLIPDTPIDPYRAPAGPKPARNMNPSLNNLSTSQRSGFEKGLFTQHLRGSVGAAGVEAKDDFMAGNPGAVSPQALAEMRRQLYGKMAWNAPAALVLSNNGNGDEEEGAGKREAKVPEGFRPSFFNDPQSAPFVGPAPGAGGGERSGAKGGLAAASRDDLLAALAASTSAKGQQPKEPRDSESVGLAAFLEKEAALARHQKAETGPALAPAHSSTTVEADAFDEGELAYVATVAASTLLNKMVAAMYRALKLDGSDGWDVAKVAAVIEGRRKLGVVDEEQKEEEEERKDEGRGEEEVEEVERLGGAMGRLRVVGEEKGTRQCAMEAWAKQRLEAAGPSREMTRGKSS